MKRGKRMSYIEIKNLNKIYNMGEVEIKALDNTSFNIASLTFLANIRVLKMADLGQLLGAGSQQAKENLYSVIEAQNHLMSNMDKSYKAPSFHTYYSISASSEKAI